MQSTLNPRWHDTTGDQRPVPEVERLDLKPLRKPPGSKPVAWGQAAPPSSTIVTARSDRLARIWLGLIGLLFCVTGAEKALHFAEFASSIAAYRIVFDAFTHPAAVVVIAAELIAALLLVVPRWQRIGAVGAIALLCSFAVVVAASVINQLDIDCGCSTVLAPALTVSWWLVARNAALATTCAIAGWSLSRHVSRHVSRRLASWCIAGSVLVATAAVWPLAQWQAQHIAAKSTAGAVGGALRPDTIAAPVTMPESGHKAPPTETTQATPVPALTVPPIIGFDFSQSEETWLFAFSTTCDHCKAIMPIWNQLFTDNKTKDQSALRMIGVVVKGEFTDEFRKEHGIEFPVHAPADTTDFVHTLKITGLPHAALVNRHGRVVEQLW